MTVSGAHTHPYVGLRPYNRDESELFRGRDDEAREIATLWQAVGLTVLYGASGVGKTSLLNAGVLPRLDPGRVDLLPIARIAPRMRVPTGRGNPYVMALLTAWAPDRDERDLAKLTLTEFLEGRPERKDEYDDPVPVLAAIDQAEEMFQTVPAREKERRAFLDQLATAVRQNTGLHLLLSMREEYLFMILPYERPFGQGARTRFHLQPLSRDAALEAVTEPLEHTDRTISHEAAELIVDGLRSVVVSDEAGVSSKIELDTVEPVQLQVVCSALWESLPPEVHEITVDHARQYSDIEEALSGFCRRAIDNVAEEFAMSSVEIQFWLRNTFITEHGTRNTVYEGLELTQGMPNAVARALEDRRVLRGEHRLGIRWYELAHDRLISPVRRSESPAVYLREARAALARRAWDSAQRLADEAVRASAYGDEWVRAEAAEVFAEVAAAQGDVEAALLYCTQAADLYAKWRRFDGVARVLTMEGQLWLSQGDHSMAIRRISAALSWAPNDMSAQLALAEALRRSGTPRAAAAVVRGVADRLPAHLLRQARELLLETD
ncbi:hypothetical protein ABT294_24455 [Nonomuraea sp. NPDC000554]|uniref:nSTAND1 domain-containing NTPase n=1 Tax=Nonomuraea sp. NPDC000554 TaxID=3154259 RepID=UPI0033169020